MFKKSYIPNSLTYTRYILALILFYGIIKHFFLFSLVLLVFAFITDALDGYLARKFNCTSDRGAYLDVTADFALIFSCFLAYFFLGWYDPLVLLLIITIFILFLVTSGSKKPVYDPMGKYLGTYLMGMIFITLILPELIVRQILQIILILISLFSVVSRLLFFRRS